MRKVLTIVLSVVFLISGALLLRQNAAYLQAQESRQQALEAAGLSQPEQPVVRPDESSLPTPPPEEPTQPTQPMQPEPVPPEEEPSVPAAVPPEPEQPEQRPLEEQAAYLWDVELAGLQQTNPDVLGWISIPGTQLDYPFVQGEDNQYYLNHTWQGKRSSAGSVFLECKVDGQFGDFNTIVYGHNMKNGSMFGSLRQYRTQSHYQDNPYIYVADSSGIRRYEIFAAFEAEVTGYTYRLDITTPEKKQAFLEYSAQHSVLQTDVVPTAEDSIITLSTCTGNGYDYRWVVQGVLTGTFTAPEPPAPEGEP